MFVSILVSLTCSILASVSLGNWDKLVSFAGVLSALLTGACAYSLFASYAVNQLENLEARIDSAEMISNTPKVFKKSLSILASETNEKVLITDLMAKIDENLVFKARASLDQEELMHV